MSGPLLFKVPLVGAFAVGKTSLVRRFVESVFDERYLTTVGVKVDRASVDVDGREVSLVLWDLAGEDLFQQLESAYVRGAAGVLYVADGTRPATLDKCLELVERLRPTVGDVPRLLLTNKSDLTDEWRVDPEQASEVAAAGLELLPTSAKTGRGVQEAFERLARDLVRSREGND